MESAVNGRATPTVATWRCAAHSHAASALLLTAFFWVVSAAAYSGFMGKWGLRDDSPRFSIDRVLDRTAQKPFVYRQLVPLLATAADAAIPDSVKQRLIRKFSPQPVFVKTLRIEDPDLRFRYAVISHLSFLAFFLSLFLLRQIAADAGASEGAAILAATSLVLAFPYLQTRGGYYYDSTELLFFSAAFLLAARGKVGWLIALVLPATLNKETFFFFIPTLYPLLMQRLPLRRSATAVIASLLLAGALNVAVKAALIDAPGEATEFHLLSNLATYFSPSSYGETELTYGLAGPAGTSAATLLLIVLIGWHGWPRVPEVVRRHLRLAGAINLPLFLAFGYAGEWRNLSLLFVGTTIVLAMTIDGVIKQSPHHKEAAP